MTAKTLGSIRQKGRQGEIEVVKLYRGAGYSDAARAPGSGAMRPYGVGDLSPWPGDVSFVLPWLVEVKFNEQSKKGGTKNWPGSSFIKATLRDLDKLAARRNAIAGKRYRDIPVLWIRASFEPWRVFVPAPVLQKALHSAHIHEGYAELDQYTYFSLVEPEWRLRG